MDAADPVLESFILGAVVGQWGALLLRACGVHIGEAENLSWVQGTPPSVGRDLNLNPVADLGASFVGLQGSWALLKQFFLEDSAVLFLPLDAHPPLLLPGSLGVWNWGARVWGKLKACPSSGR